ncbi:hypothetical protein EIP86_009366 [Pleurotus ostreatoroseus]|nr:hypothetical protein EIP86_009366 [Pleurotus ostreatoroseus]
MCAAGLITAGWTLVWGIGAFQDTNVDKDEKETKFATLDIVLGILYMVTCAIALFGVIAATMDKLLWVRIYAILSFVGGLCVVGAGFIRTVTHFVFKNDLITECEHIVTGDQLTFRFGIWGPVVHETLDAADAADFCKSGWSHDSFTEVVSLLVVLVLMLLFCGIAWTYYRQLLDPASARDRAPSAQFRPPSNPNANASSDDATAFPEHYAPPYLGYDAPAPTYAPPAGPPPGFLSGGAKGMAEPPVYDPIDGAQKGYLDARSHDGKDDGEDPFADFESVSAKGASRERFV